MTRNVWQGLLKWWNPPAKASSKAEPELESDPDRSKRSQMTPGSGSTLGGEGSSGWVLREMTPTGSALGASVATNESDDSEEREINLSPRHLDVSLSHSSEAEPTEEELMDFLAADFEPDEADPEFKSKLRDELWALVQKDEMTRH